MHSKYIKLICNILNCKKDDITNIQDYSGMTNMSYTFIVNRQKYLIRIPGIGTNKFINRKNEFNTYKLIAQFNDDVIYFNVNTGIKISKFVNNGRSCNVNNRHDIQLCMRCLSNFHKMKLITNYTFDLKKEINKYEKLMHKSKYIDYDITYINVMQCIKYIKSLNRPMQLIHIDPNPDNFLITTNKVYLLDWEYAAMQDPLLDIAMFAIYSNYNEKQIKRLYSIYAHKKDNDELTIIYAYCAIAGLLWSNWCEYKEHLGQTFGEYSFNQYNYAKKFSKKVLKRIYFQKNL